MFLCGGGGGGGGGAVELCSGRGVSCPLSCDFGLASCGPIRFHPVGPRSVSASLWRASVPAWWLLIHISRAKFSRGLGLVSSHAASAWRFLGSASLCCAVKSLPRVPSDRFCNLFSATRPGCGAMLRPRRSFPFFARLRPGGSHPASRLLILVRTGFPAAAPRVCCCCSSRLLLLLLASTAAAPRVCC